ncbi:hypothetical protein B0I32_14046 [Nonomuraea fuscirosea]|uniref:Uncharacterized protein n=1 Tax=Nonomuraea fuscirosea TaxID=1291556 RepID=A0A2T0LXP8_9ACTN|nr:hypothetical protein B0I32_14046 [Nonomuraea fuscirosea]
MEAVAEQRETGSAVHLAHDAFGLGVHSFGAAVVEGQRDGVAGGVAVLVEATGESVQVRQVGGAGAGDPGVETVGVVFMRPQEAGETADEPGQVGHLGAGGGEGVQQAPVLILEVIGVGEQEPGSAARRDGQPVGFDSRPWVMSR